jgi:hypothetical protein
MKPITLALAASFIFSAAALAQTPPAPAGGGMSGGGGGRIPECRDDGQKFCADKRGPERRACLTENKDKLSDACKAALTAAGG